MTRRRIAVMLLACLFTLCFGVSAFAAEPETTTDSGLRKPVTESNDSLSTGRMTTWCCITFGSYPQTEIIPAPSDAVDGFAVQDGDFLEDPELYEKLVQAEWTDNETEMDGIRYRRMGREDAVTSASDRAGHYRWGEGDEWHYFRFDPIRWRVIGLEDGKAFLMADRLLDCQPYHTDDAPVDWERSAVRSWLNGYPGTENDAGMDYRGKGFLDTAFSEAEREAVVTTRVANAPNATYGTDCGPETEDRVFLLSNDEVYSSEAAAENGFNASNEWDDPAKRFRSTMYAKCRGAWWSSVNGYMGNSFWFMRTNGYNRGSVTYICDFGFVYRRGTVSTCDDAGVLPALWIDLDRAWYEPAGTVTSADIQANAFRDTEGDPRQKARIVNPIVTEDPEEPDGKKVTYSLVRFGSYPQSEIVPVPAGGSGEGTTDRELYEALEKAEWADGECEIDGRRYLRGFSTDENGREYARYFAYEPLVWRALEVRDGTVLLLSHQAVDCGPFQKDLRDVSWENCTLRSWLNGYGAQANISGADYSGEGGSFLSTAFSEDERSAIREYPVRNEDNYYFGMDSGHETRDRIFIPAESEIFMHDSSVIHGFSPRDEVSDRAKQFTPTDYAVWRGAWKASDGSGNVFWFTRTTGYTHANAVYVGESGCMYNRGILVTCEDASILPALVLDLDSSVYEYAGTYTIGIPEAGT